MHACLQTIHNGSDPSGKRVFLTLLQNRTSLVIRPVTGGDQEGSTPSVKFPVRTILRLEIGKTKSSVLGRSIYDHIHPMNCFSIVVKLWTDAETYFDFEASSTVEREALISTIMVVLDQMHNNNNKNNNNNNNNNNSQSSPRNNTTPTSSLSSTAPAAFLYPRKASPVSASPSSTENQHFAGNKGTPPTITAKQGISDAKDQPDVCLSPGRRTKIYSNTYFEDHGEDQQGTEISLVYNTSKTNDEKSTTQRWSPRHNSSNSSQPKPLRQRQLQPAAETSDDPNPTSPPRTTRFRQTPRDFMSDATSKPLTPSRNSSNVSKSTSANKNSMHKHSSPMEVVDEKNRDETDEHQDGSDSSEGGFVIMPLSHPDQPESDIEIGLGGSPEGDIQVDLSFDIASQGLPVSKIQFSPTRDNFDPQSGCCNLAPPTLDHMNPNVAWCSDDICTLALKDIAETCTGIFDHHGDNAAIDMGGDTSTPAKVAAERAFMEEYIAGVLGGPTSALGAFFPDSDVWNIDSKKRPADKRKVNRIRNRASLLNAQATRLRTLRNEMTFAAALKRSNEKMQYVQTTKSFDDADLERLRERSVNRFNSSALMERMMGGMVLSKPEVEEEAVYYDSDPEDMRPRTKGVRRALANRRNLVGEEEAERHQTRPVLSGVGFERIAVGKKLRKLDESLIIQIVQVRGYLRV
jgi:hypothetical protein